MTLAPTSKKQPRKRRKSGIKQIAAEAGCSVSTVSRIINRYPNFRVSDEVRNRVLAVAEKHDYAPHPILRTIRAKKTWMVSLLDENVHMHDMVAVMRRTFVAQMQKAGYQVGCNFLRGDKSKPTHELPDWNVDGVAFTNACNVASFAKLDESGLPYASMNGECGPGGVAVMPDEAAGMTQVMDHLAALGHRRIAYACHDQLAESPAHRHSSRTVRQDRYVDYMQQRGEQPLVKAESGDTPLGKFVRDMVNERGVTAIVGYNLFTGVALLQEAWRLGLSVPTQLSVICFDDLYPSEFTTPPMTCIRHPVREIGTKAGELLTQMIEDPQTLRGSKHVLQPSLTVRESTGPAPS